MCRKSSILIKIFFFFSKIKRVIGLNKYLGHWGWGYFADEWLTELGLQRVKVNELLEITRPLPIPKKIGNILLDNALFGCTEKVEKSWWISLLKEK